MKHDQDYLKDITEIRSMMERSSKFKSLSGWSGVLLGVYSLAGAFTANMIMQSHGDMVLSDAGVRPGWTPVLQDLAILAVVLMALALFTAIFLAFRKSRKINEQIWNPTVRALVINMAIPLVTGGIMILIMASKGMIGIALPMMLLFYGLTLASAAKFSYAELRYLGLINIGLALMATFLIEYSLLFWAIGFGIMHIIYGLYIHLRYEK